MFSTSMPWKKLLGPAKRMALFTRAPSTRSRFWLPSAPRTLGVTFLKLSPLVQIPGWSRSSSPVEGAGLRASSVLPTTVVPTGVSKTSRGLRVALTTVL